MLPFLAVSFLLEFSSWLMLVGFAFLFGIEFHVWQYLAIVMLFVPLVGFLLSLYAEKILSFFSTKFLYMLGLTLFFLVVILLNKNITQVSFPIIILLWSTGKVVLDLAEQSFRYENTKDFLGKYKYLARPTKLFAPLLAILIAPQFLALSSFSELFNYFGIMVAAASLIYVLGMQSKTNKALEEKEALSKVTVKAETKATVNALVLENFMAIFKGKANRTTMANGLITGFYFVVLPAALFSKSGDMQASFNPLIALLLPLIVLSLLKNVFQIKIPNLKPFVKYLAIISIFCLFPFLENQLLLLISSGLLGLVWGLLQLAASQETYYAKNYGGFHRDYYLGMLFAIVGGGLAVLKIGIFFAPLLFVVVLLSSLAADRFIRHVI